MPDAPIVVSGGGIAGLTAALVCARHGHDVLLLDQPVAAIQGSLGFDLRSVALSPGSCQFLAELGVPMGNLGCDILEMHVWENDGTAAVDFCAWEVKQDALATVFEHRVVEAMLAAEVAGTVTRQANSIESIEEKERILHLADGAEVKPKLLVIAEGTRARTLNLLSRVEVRQRSFEQLALVGLLRMDTPHRQRAVQVFGGTPLALLPYCERDLVSMIWSLPIERAARIKSMDDAALAQLVTRTSEAKLGGVLAVDELVSFPVQHRLLSDFNPLPWVLVVGDAAHTVHPLAGQGVNLGLEDVRAMNKVMARHSGSVSRPNLWRSFAARRRQRAQVMLQAMAFFNSIYQHTNPYIRLARNFGVRALNNSSILRRQLMREAMGLGPIGRA